MSNTIHYTACPSCGATNIRPVLTAIDHTVSHEKFMIYECGTCTLRFTQDVPNADSIGPYYKSENYISHSNTSKGLVNSLYQSVRKRTIASKCKMVEKLSGVTKGDLLDMGSGVGTFASAMQQRGWNVTGLEPDADARAMANQLYQLKLDDTSRFNSLTPASYDAITLWHVLEHVHALHEYVQQLRHVLKPGGKIFIAVPNYTSKDAVIYGQYWAAYDVPRHLYHFSPKSMEILMQKNGLKIERLKPMWYDSFYISLLSSKYKSGKASLPGAAISGLRSNIRASGNTALCSSVIYVIGK